MTQVTYKPYAVHAMLPIQKLKNHRKNSSYIKWLRCMPCCVCKAPAEPHHVRSTTTIPYQLAGGTGLKPNDLMCIPLCRAHHNETHDSPDELGTKYNIDMKRLLIFYLAKYIMERLDNEANI